MPLTLATSPVQLPEILSLIAEFLNRDGRARCARVCKLWYRAFLPSIWGRKIELGNGVPEPTLESLQRHSHLVHNVDMVHDITGGLHRLLEFPNLKSLTAHFSTHRDLLRQKVTIMILAHPTIECLKLKCRGRSLSWVWGAIAELPHLKTLHVWSVTIHAEEAESFWTVCARSDELQLHSVSILGVPKLQDPRIFPMMKKLTLAGRTNSPDLWLMQRCPNIQELAWSTLGTYDTSNHREFKRLVSAGTWPELESLLLSGNLDDEDLATVLSGLNKITALQLCGKFGPKCSSILRRHVSTIQNLDLCWCNNGMLATAMLQEIRSTCPLIKNTVEPFSGYKIV